MNTKTFFKEFQDLMDNQNEMFNKIKEMNEALNKVLLALKDQSIIPEEALDTDEDLGIEGNELDDEEVDKDEEADEDEDESEDEDDEDKWIDEKE